MKTGRRLPVVDLGVQLAKPLSTSVARSTRGAMNLSTGAGRTNQIRYRIHREAPPED